MKRYDPMLIPSSGNALSIFQSAVIQKIAGAKLRTPDVVPKHGDRLEHTRTLAPVSASSSPISSVQATGGISINRVKRRFFFSIYGTCRPNGISISWCISDKNGRASVASIVDRPLCETGLLPSATLC